jgi:uncharacterized protein (TIGR04255 family)
LGKPPVVDAVIEMRFESQIPSEAVFGVVWNELKTLYSKYEKNPIMQLPADLLERDPNFQYMPHYKLQNNESICQIGPRVVVLAMKKYLTWDDFCSTSIKVIEKIFKAVDELKVQRVGIRYINFFEYDVFSNDKIKLNLSVGCKSGKPVECTSKVLFENSKGIKTNVQCANNAQYKPFDGSGTVISGSVIDIDSFVDSHLDSKCSIEALLPEIHKTLKELFFDILTKELVESLEPDYGDEA